MIGHFSAEEAPCSDICALSCEKPAGPPVLRQKISKLIHAKQSPCCASWNIQAEVSHCHPQVYAVSQKI